MHEIERFWAQVSTDPTLKAALAAALPESPAAEQLAAFVRQHGFEVTPDDVREHQSAAGELSDEALDAVAGGGDMPPQEPIDPVEEPLEFPPPEEDPAMPPPEGEVVPPPTEEPRR